MRFMPLRQIMLESASPTLTGITQTSYFTPDVNCIANFATISLFFPEHSSPHPPNTNLVAHAHLFSKISQAGSLTLPWIPLAIEYGIFQDQTPAGTDNHFRV